MTQTEIILSILRENKPKLLTVRQIFDILKTRPEDYDCFDKGEKDQEKRDKQIRAQIGSILAGTLVKKELVRVYKEYKPQKYEYIEEQLIRLNPYFETKSSNLFDILGRNLNEGDKVLVRADLLEEDDDVIKFRKALIVKTKPDILYYVYDANGIMSMDTNGTKESMLLLDNEIARTL